MATCKFVSNRVMEAKFCAAAVRSHTLADGCIYRQCRLTKVPKGDFCRIHDKQKDVIRFDLLQRTNPQYQKPLYEYPDTNEFPDQRDKETYDTYREILQKSETMKNDITEYLNDLYNTINTMAEEIREFRRNVKNDGTMKGCEKGAQKLSKEIAKLQKKLENGQIKYDECVAQASAAEERLASIKEQASKREAELRSEIQAYQEQQERIQAEREAAKQPRPKPEQPVAIIDLSNENLSNADLSEPDDGDTYELKTEIDSDGDETPYDDKMEKYVEDFGRDSIDQLDLYGSWDQNYTKETRDGIRLLGRTALNWDREVVIHLPSDWKRQLGCPSRNSSCTFRNNTGNFLVPTATNQGVLLKTSRSGFDDKDAERFHIIVNEATELVGYKYVQYVDIERLEDAKFYKAPDEPEVDELPEPESEVDVEPEVKSTFDPDTSTHALVRDNANLKAYRGKYGRYTGSKKVDQFGNARYKLYFKGMKRSTREKGFLASELDNATKDEYDNN